MRRRLIRIALILLLFPPILAAVAGWLGAPGFLHPLRRELTPDLIREADTSFAVTHSSREDFTVRAPDGVLLHGWKVHPPNPNGNWVILFHGVADNRIGVISQSEFLLRAGYSVVMMDARSHGASEGTIATYGWLERTDTKSIVDALLASLSSDRIPTETRVAPSNSAGAGLVYPDPVGARPAATSAQMHPSGHPPILQMSPGFRPPPSIYPSQQFEDHGIFHVPLHPPPHVFALGESMGAGIALQSAAADPRIEAVVAEAPFASLREASYDYAGLRRSPLLGKTLFRPFSWALIYHGEKIAGIDISQVSPEKSVASRSFPLLLICDEKDDALPCRHAQQIYNAALGPKQLWVVPGAFHTAALGFQPAEFQRRVLTFFNEVIAKSAPKAPRY
jgi:alpha-beta hydrolase superfamily lysophospholipase